MRLHYFQHVPFEDPAFILNWARENNHTLTGTHFYKDTWMKPSVDQFDWLVIMGGPMSVYDRENYPWLLNEKKMIEQAILKGKIIIGICLGAQLIANVLGARVYPNHNKEIGWFPVDRVNVDDGYNYFTTQFMAFHWHGDTFDIPCDAQHLMRSEGCANQAFCYQNRVFAFQFHLESTPESVKSLVINCGSELTQGPFIQSENEILHNKNHFPQMHRSLSAFLDALGASALPHTGA